jgi:hypothetical protein
MLLDRSAAQGLLRLAALTLLALLGPAAAASAQPCSQFDYFLSSSGAQFGIFQGYVDESRSFGKPHDTWVEAGRLAYRIGDAPSFSSIPVPDATDCPLEDDQREIVLPPVAVGSGVSIGGKVFVPVEGAFARVLTTVSNGGSVPRTVDLAYTTYHEGGATTVLSTSSGDGEPGTTDHWAVQSDGNGAQGFDSAAGWFSWQSPLSAADRADVVSRNEPGFPNTTSPDEIYAQFDDIVVAPGASVTYMSVVGQGVDHPAAEVGARRTATTGPELTAGMTATEIASVRNWSFDADGDGGRDARRQLRPHGERRPGRPRRRRPGRRVRRRRRRRWPVQRAGGAARPRSPARGLRRRRTRRRDRPLPHPCRPDGDACPHPAQSSRPATSVPAVRRPHRARAGARVHERRAPGACPPRHGVVDLRACHAAGRHAGGRVHGRRRAGPGALEQAILALRRVRLQTTCAYSTRVRLPGSGRRRLTVLAEFLGSDRLKPRSATLGRSARGSPTKRPRPTRRTPPRGRQMACPA